MSEKCILIVDDAASVRNSLRRALETQGFRVVEADNGQRGLEAVATHDVDLMIVDLNMPIMDGFEMISRVRAIPRHKHTPVFILTTESGPSAVREGRSAGATAWIVKPVRPEVLITGIRGVLGTERKARPGEPESASLREVRNDPQKTCTDGRRTE